MDNAVIVKSTVRAQVSINVPALNLRRSWARKGAIQKIPFDVLEQAYYEPGVEYLFRTGALYIEDMEAKIALGLEEPETKEPTNVINMTDEYAKKLLTATPLKDLRDEVEKLSHEQLVELSRMAIDMHLTDYHRCEILKNKTGIDVMTASIARQEEEAQKENN